MNLLPTSASRRPTAIHNPLTRCPTSIWFDPDQCSDKARI